MREDLEVATRQLQEAGLEPKWPRHRNHVNHHNGSGHAGTLAVAPVACEEGAGQLSRRGSGGTSCAGCGGEGKGGGSNGGSRSGASSKVPGCVSGLRAVPVAPQPVGPVPDNDGCS